MPRILVTGGDGFIGRRVVARLREQKHEVWLTSLTAEQSGDVIAVDLTQPHALHGRLHGFDAVVHLAARSGGVGFQRSPDPTVYSDNRAMTDSVLSAALADGVGRVFLASSTVIYQPQSQRPHPESDPRLTADDRPSPYAWSKICDELVAGWMSNADTSVVIGRFANVFGPEGASGEETGTVIHTLIRRAIESAAAGREDFGARGDPAAVRSFVHVEDVASAVVLLTLDERALGTYNIDSGVAITIGQAADVIATATAPGLRAVFADSGATDVPYRVADPSRIGTLGFSSAVDFAEGVAECVVAIRRRLTEGQPT